MFYSEYFRYRIGTTVDAAIMMPIAKNIFYQLKKNVKLYSALGSGVMRKILHIFE
jgi:hypothetical protein